MSNRQLTVAPPQTPDITKEKVSEYLDAFGLSTQLTDNEKTQFIEIACEFKLNPFKREIFCVPYGQGDSRKLSIITGYEVYIKRADRSGKLNGWRAWTEGTGEDLKALVEIHRRDWEKPFLHEVYWRESAQKKRDGTLTAFWVKQPRFQLKKVAISQGFRLCFPDELGGIPYDPNELPEEMSAPEGLRNVTPAARQEDRKSSSQPATSHSPVRTSRTNSAPAPTSSEPAAAKPSGGNGGKPSPAPSASKSPEVESERKTLIDQINRIISTNSISFPAAHIRWVQSQLRGSPSLQRLQEILTHLANALSEGEKAPEQPAPAASVAEGAEEEPELFKGRSQP
jgi:phage recombination protein Bet